MAVPLTDPPPETESTIKGDDDADATRTTPAGEDAAGGTRF